MPEPAAVEVKQELTFKTHQEKIDALERLQNERDLGPDDLPEIDRITNAKVLEPEAEEVEAQPTPTAAPEPKPVEGAKPVVQAEPVVPQTEVRNWQITEDLLKKYDEEYTDHGGRKRPTFLAKDPEGFVKSAADAQKYIRYLESKRLPDAESAGYARAKRELEADMARARKELEELRAKVAAQPAPAPQAQAAAVPPKPAASVDYRAVIDEFDAVPNDDKVDHLDKLAKALKAAVSRIDEQNETIARIDKEGPTALKGLEQRQKDSEAQAEAQRKARQDEDERKRLDAENKKQWETACQLVDGFQSSKDCPADLRIGRSWRETTADVIRFHNELATLATGKPISEITDADAANAAALYFDGQPELAQKVRNYGIQEPADYRKWVTLDQLDALRIGLVRDPVTKQWKHRYDPDRKQVTFPDLSSAYREFLAMTGQDKAIAAKAAKSQTDQVIAAIQTRDKGLIAMDESRAMQQGQGGVIGEEEALRRQAELEAMGGIEEAQRRARHGDKEMMNQYNIILQALGAPAMA